MIERDGSFLIAQRPPDKHMGLKLMFRMWVSLQELRDCDMAPADRPIVDKLLSRA